MVEVNCDARTFSIEMSQFCCGLYEIGSFRDNVNSFRDNVKEFVRELSTIVATEYVEDDDGENLEITVPLPSFIATTVSGQEEFSKGLLSVGFKEIGKFINPNTDNEVTTYYRNSDNAEILLPV